jgi:hypothetical protein
MTLGSLKVKDLIGVYARILNAPNKKFFCGRTLSDQALVIGERTFQSLLLIYPETGESALATSWQRKIFDLAPSFIRAVYTKATMQSAPL